MAQVRKFQPGGKLTINGKDYTIDQLNEYMNSGGFSSQERAALAGTIQSIAGGASRTFDRNANSISGDGVTNDFADFYGNVEKAERNQGRSTRWANRQARRNSDHHIVNSALEKLGGIEDYYNTKKKEKESEKIRLYKGSDDNGFYTSDGRFLEGPENSQNISRITAIFDALQSGDLSKYDLQDWGGDITLSGLADWYTAQNGGFNRGEFFTRLRNNQLTDLDWEILSKMGFTPGTTSGSGNESGSNTSHKDWKGNADAATRAGVYFTKNADGTWNINGNQDYLNSTWYGGGLDFLAGTEFEGGGIHNGRLYTRQQILNNDPSLQGAFGAWMTARDTAKDHRSWYDLANASGVRFVGDRTSRGTGADDYGIFTIQFNPYTHYNEYWSDYFKGLNLGNRAFDVADMSPAYTNLDGRQVLAYIDPNNTHDNMGIRSVKYVVRNADGTYTQYDSEDALKAAGFITNADAYGFTPGEIRRDLWETIGNKKYRYVQDIVTSGGQNNVILADEYGNLYLAAKGPDGKHLNPRPIDEETVQQAVESPQSTTTLDLEKGIRKEKQENRRLLWSALAQSGQSVLRKNGGKIKPLPEKFQYGGNVGKTTTTTKDNSTEGKRTDITATHKTNGSDGGLTDAEKMQIAAAVGDLAGVGLSFVPGAHIAGSIAGLGATATRFAADVKKDGFQGKDFWSALGGAALDVASLVPILGTGAKTAKAAKALKAAATPIMKVLSVAGAINGANAMGKVIRGEEVTSEDITAILSGLGSAAIAGKQLKDTIGDARLARQVAQKSKAAITGEKLGKTLPKSRKEISELLENASTEKKAIDKVKELLGNNATDEAAKDVLKEWGVDTNQSRFKGKDGWKEYLKFWKKGEATVSIDTPDTDVKSVFGYVLNPFARTKQLGYDIGYKQSSGNLGQLSKKELADAYNAVKAGTASGKQIAIVRNAASNPSAFRFKLGPAQNINSGWGWPIYGREPVGWNGVTPYTPPRSPISVNNGRVRLLTPADFQAQADARRMMYASLEDDVYANGSGLPRFAQRVDDEYYGQGLPLNYITKSSEFMPTRMLAWKNGGKIQFAKNGTKITKHQDTSMLPDPARDSVTGKLFSEMTDQEWLAYIQNLNVQNKNTTKSAIGFNYADLTEQEKADYKTAMEAAKTSGQDFIYKGYNFGKVGTSANTPTESNTTLPSILSNSADEIGSKNLQNAIANIGEDYNRRAAQAVSDIEKISLDPGTETSDEYSLGYDILRDSGRPMFKKHKEYITDIARQTAIANGTDPKQAAKDRLKQLRAEITSDKNRERQSRLGSGTGSGSNSNLGWNIAGNVLGSVGKAASAFAASKRQMDLVNDMKPFQEQQAPEHSFRYRDPGIDLAYNNAINQQQSYARNFKSSDQALNAAVGLQTADKTAQLELERGLKKSQLFGEQQAQHQNLLQQEAQNRTAVVNRNAERNNQMDAYKRQMKGAYIAQNQGITQGLISDIAGIGQQATAGKKALAAFDAKNAYSDNMSGLRTQYQTGINNGSIASGTSFDDWAMANHKDKIREWQRAYLASQYSFKKGGRIRPTSEQIKIDNEKARHKAIAQLSKQAFELLKMALK